MKTIFNTTIENVRIAAERSFSAAMLLTLIVTGCTDDNSDVAEAAKTTGALSGSSQDTDLRRPHRHSGRDGQRDGKRHSRHGRKGGRHGDPEGMLFKTALGLDSLTAEQRETVESLMAESKPKQEGTRKEAQNAFRTTLAQAVRDGNIDANALKAHFEARAQQREARMAARSERLNKLYAVLTAEQRQAVVAELKTRQAEKMERFKGANRGDGGNGKGFGKEKRGRRHGDSREHGMADNPKRPRDGQGFRGKRGRHGGRGDGVSGLVKGLDLTEAQQAQMAALKGDRGAKRQDKAARRADKEAMKQCRTSFLESFAQDNFDPTARCRKRSDQDRIARMDQRIANLSSVIGILTDEQRQQLADRLENPPKRRGKSRAL